MTRDQMHNTLRYVREQLADERGSDFSGVEALDMVIAELEQEPILDKIRAEIEMYEADCILADDSKECIECDKIVFGSIYRIIDKYRKEQE